MYKLTFEDKPEANTYVKWARQKGYLVEGPYREKLSKNVKKFDLNGKRKKYSFVVLRKRGVGREGGVPSKGAWEDRLGDAYKWMKENRRGFGGSWAQLRRMVYQHEKGLPSDYRGELPDMKWDMPPEYMVGYLRVVRGEPKEKAIAQVKKAGEAQGVADAEKKRTVAQSKLAKTTTAQSKLAKTTTDYFEASPKEIRGLATKMGIPTDKPLPKVLVMGEGAGKEYSKTPMLQKSTLEADKPSGYVITIPESMLKRVTKKGKETNYILGTRTRENIKHELAHYEERSKTGAETGEEKTPYDEAIKEIKADIRTGRKSMPLALAQQSYRLKEKYGLDDKEAFKVIEKAAKDLGVKKGTITRARGWEITGKIPQPQLNPKSIQKASSLPTPPLSKRWMGDSGSMPGEPMLFLDVKGDDLDTAKAAIIERVDKQGNAVYELIDSSGKGKGFFQTEEDAGKYAESIYSESKKRGSPKGSGKKKEGTGKIPATMQPLAQEAAKYDKFEDFEKAFSHEIKHGRYYHVTDNPNFKIDSSTGPQDASSMAGKPVPAKGKLMITSDLDNWAAEYKGKRQYVAIIDMSEVPKGKYWQVNRGFGNEFWVDDPSKAKVIKVVPMSQAKVDSRLHHKALPSSKEKLMDFYEKIKEQATQEFPIQPEIKKVMTGAEPKTAKKEPWQMTKKEFDKFYREGWVHRVGEGETATKGAQLKGSFKKGWFRKGEQTVGAAPSDQILLPKETKFEPTLQKSKAYSRWEGELPPSAVILSEKTVKRGAGKPELIHASIVAEAIKEKKHVPLKVLREHRDVVKEEIKERKKAKAEKERVREDKERAEKAEKEEAKYWEETKLTKEQQSRDEEVEALKAEAESYEKEEKEVKETKKEEKEVAAHE